MTQTIPDDPFAEERYPAVSFKDAKIGTSYTGTVVKAPQVLQARDFETGEPAWWDEAKTQPKQTVLTVLEINGELLGLWAAKSSKDGSLYRAIQEARKKAGQPVAVGGTLQVIFAGEEPSANKRLSPRKLYEANYTPPASAPQDEEPPF